MDRLDVRGTTRAELTDPAYVAHLLSAISSYNNGHDRNSDLWFLAKMLLDAERPAEAAKSVALMDWPLEALQRRCEIANYYSKIGRIAEANAEIELAMGSLEVIGDEIDRIDGLIALADARLQSGSHDDAAVSLRAAQGKALVLQEEESQAGIEAGKYLGYIHRMWLQLGAAEEAETISRATKYPDYLRSP